jgi:16S rRNA (cytidine1402-2'-O)-methyltransferase
VTIVLEGAAAGAEGDAIDPRIEAARATLDAMLDAGLKPRERAKKLAELTGMDARELYDRLRGRD